MKNCLFVLLGIILILGVSLICILTGDKKSQNSNPPCKVNCAGEFKYHRTGELPCGYCGDADTSDPRIFGPVVWDALHIMAQNYPDYPSKETENACQNFITGLPWMLPCGQCGRHLHKFIELNNQNNNVAADECMGAPFESVCQSLPNVCSSKQNIVSFFTRAHNNVSHITHPCRKKFSITDAQNMYTTKNACFHNILWGDKSLKRSIDSA